jgi:hypothetical protein
VDDRIDAVDRRVDAVPGLQVAACPAARLASGRLFVAAEDPDRVAVLEQGGFDGTAEGSGSAGQQY